jgi:hypothetical protein
VPAGAALVLSRAPLDVPIVLGREEAQRLARLELAKPIYTADQEPWSTRLMRWVVERISDLLDRVGTTSPLGWFGLLGLALVVGIVVVVVRRRIGGLRRATSGSPLFDGADRGAADFRAAAERYAASGAWAEAVRARLRAVVLELEERGLVDVRPGRTADEVARDAGRALPAAAADLLAGARLFDDVWYGGRPADATTYARLVAVDEAVAVARPDRGAPREGSPLAVPR